MAGAHKPVTDGLIAALRSRTWPNGEPLSIGDHRAPDPPAGEARPRTPYSAVERLATAGEIDEDWDDAHEDLASAYQVTSVGVSRGSAEAQSDAVRRSLLERTPAGPYAVALAVAGREVTRRQQLLAGPARREGDRWNVVDQYEIWSAPSP
jgi:hypothetical protein